MNDWQTQWLEKLDDLIITSLAKGDLSNESLAKELSMSPSSFYRRVQKLTGQTPNHYISNLEQQKPSKKWQVSWDLGSIATFQVYLKNVMVYFLANFQKIELVLSNDERINSAFGRGYFGLIFSLKEGVLLILSTNYDKYEYIY